MTWCENNGIDYIFGLSGTKPLVEKSTSADDIRTRRAIENLAVLRGYTEAQPRGKVLGSQRRTARIEATMLGLDIRFVVTSLDVGSAEWITCTWRMWPGRGAKVFDVPVAGVR